MAHSWFIEVMECWNLMHLVPRCRRRAGARHSPGRKRKYLAYRVNPISSLASAFPQSRYLLQLKLAANTHNYDTGFGPWGTPSPSLASAFPQSRYLLQLKMTAVTHNYGTGFSPWGTPSPSLASAFLYFSHITITGTIPVIVQRTLVAAWVASTARIRGATNRPG